MIARSSTSRDLQGNMIAGTLRGMDFAHEVRPAVGQAKDALSAALSVDIASVRTLQGPGVTFDFSDALPSLWRTQVALQQVLSRDLQKLPELYLNKVRDAANLFTSFVGELRSFSPTDGQAQSKRLELIRRAAIVFSEVCNEVNPALAMTEPMHTAEAQEYLTRVRQEVLQTQTAIQNLVSRNQEMSDKLQKDVQNLDVVAKERVGALVKDLGQETTKAADEARRMLEGIREQAAKGVVARSAVVFAQEAKSQSKASNSWLIATIVASVALVLLAGGSLVFALWWPSTSTTQALQIGLAKIFILSGAFTVVLWCSRNYRAHRHNEVLNRHRENALNTFQLFVDGTNDSHVRDAILVQAANAAFGARSTGFDGPHHEDSAGINQVISLADRAMGSTRPDPS